MDSKQHISDYKASDVSQLVAATAINKSHISMTFDTTNGAIISQLADSIQDNIILFPKCLVAGYVVYGLAPVCASFCACARQARPLREILLIPRYSNCLVSVSLAVNVPPPQPKLEEIFSLTETGYVVSIIYGWTVL